MVNINCLEVFINRPSNLLARAQTWLSYKHHNTVKVLIVITPQSTISYVSQAWGGQTSEKFLTVSCRILNKLLPGGLVLADRGFTIAESVMFQQAQLAIPSFTKGKHQLDPVDVEKTRRLQMFAFMLKGLLVSFAGSTQYCLEFGQLTS